MGCWRFCHWCSCSCFCLHCIRLICCCFNLHILCLCLWFRFGVYVPLCCFHQEGRAQSTPTECSFSEQDGYDRPLLRPRDFLTLLRESLREQFSSPTHIPTHTCPPSPELIRSEVEELKTDFNRRIKEVLFNSLFSAYYVAFLPLCFVRVSHPLTVVTEWTVQSLCSLIRMTELWFMYM